MDSEYQVFFATMNWINHDIANRRRYIFEVLKHVRLPLVATKLLESYVNNCTDLSLKVAMTSVKKDLISQKGSLVALYVKPRKGAKKNIYVIGGENRDDQRSEHRESVGVGGGVVVEWWYEGKH